MRIMILGNFGTGWDGSICDEEHIASALEVLGHKVTRIQRGEKPEFGAYDFILVAQWDGYPPEIMKTMKHLGKKIYWAFDYQAEGQEWHERLIEGADVYLSKRIADSKYPNWQWFSQDFSPDFLDRWDVGQPKEIDVLFTGSYLPWATERNEMIKAIDNNFNLQINSVNSWDGYSNVQAPVMDDELPRLLARAKINISIDHTHEAGYWSDRNAQIMACGGFVLFRHVPLSESVFHDKIEYFNNTEQMLEKIEYFLTHDYEREIIAEEGFTYAQDCLKIDTKIKDLLTIVGSHV